VGAGGALSNTGGAPVYRQESEGAAAASEVVSPPLPVIPPGRTISLQPDGSTPAGGGSGGMPGTSGVTRPGPSADQAGPGPAPEDTKPAAPAPAVANKEGAMSLYQQMLAAKKKEREAAAAAGGAAGGGGSTAVGAGGLGVGGTAAVPPVNPRGGESSSSPRGEPPRVSPGGGRGRGLLGRGPAGSGMAGVGGRGALMGGGRGVGAGRGGRR
jgi:hypothetical protein